MTEQKDYFEYLQTRSKLGLVYRKYWLYPRLCRHLSGKVLDVGCGIGDMIRHRPQTVGVDVNPRAVEFCASQGLNVRLMAPDRLPFPDHDFDGVLLDNVLEHLEHPQPLLEEIHRVLVANGTLIVGVPGRRGFASDSDHKIFYSESSLISCMRSNGFLSQHVLYLPVRSALLDARLSSYAIYGIFRCSDRPISGLPERQERGRNDD